MFIVFGILSILAGCFVFNQAYSMIRLVQFAGATSDIGTWFAVVSICLILGGALSVASMNGEKRRFLRASIWIYGGAFLAALTHINYVDMMIWTIVCAAMVIIYNVWLSQHSPVPVEETTTYVDQDKVHKGSLDA